VKPILQNSISQTQKGFLRGRYIGECVRIISDLMDKLEKEDIPDLLMLVDFEKAFDTLKKPLNFMALVQHSVNGSNLFTQIFPVL
jgi:hypothetical protein